MKITEEARVRDRESQRAPEKASNEDKKEGGKTRRERRKVLRPGEAWRHPSD